MDDDLFSSSSPGTGTATGQPMAASDPSPGPQTLANADGPSSPSSPSPTPSHHPASRPSAPPPYSPPHPPFSPSKTELESHPIRQRLSLLHPDAEAATTPEGSPPAISLELDSWPKPPAQTTEEEGHEETPDATDMADSEIQKGDAASYSWGGDTKGGTVVEVSKDDKVEMETARGNTVTKEAKDGDPAVRLEREGHDVVKNVSELTKESAGDTHNEGKGQVTVGAANGEKPEEKKEEKKEEKTEEKEEEKVKEKPAQAEEKKQGAEETSSSTTGEKRSADEAHGKAQENGEEPAKKKSKEGTMSNLKKEVKKRMPKKAATESGEPRRSGRVASKGS